MELYYDDMSFENYINTENELSDFILDEILESFRVDVFNTESSLLNSVYNKEVVVESVSNSLLTTIKKFFVGLISEIKRFMTDIQIGAERAGRNASYRSKLNSMELEIKDAKNMGRRYVIMANIQGMLNVYKKYYSELSSQVKKICKMGYKDTLSLDRDIEVYKNIVNKYEKSFESVSKEEVRVTIDDAIKFVEHEKSGNSKVLDTLNNLITDIKLMQRDIEDIIEKEEKLGSDIIPKHVSVIGKITSDVFKSLRKMAGKILGRLVFRFA